MIFITIFTSIALIAIIYIFRFSLKIIRKFSALKKLHCMPEMSFIFGHLSTLTKVVDKNLSLSENFAILVNKYYEEHRDKCISVVWFAWSPYVVLTTYKSVEAVLSSNKVLLKSPEYRYFAPIVGDGLIVSEPKKWKQRRKMITPSFHFQILDDFLKVMNKHSIILVDIIKKKNNEVNLFDVIPLTTLDVICETAMGINLNAQREHKSQFVDAILFLNESIFNRVVRVVYWIDYIFYKTAFGKRCRKEIGIINEFTRIVVKERKNEIINNSYEKRELSNHSVDDAIFVGSKKPKLALIDLLIRSHLDSTQADGTHSFTISDICEEVDTFMFGGFETTAAAICWTLHLLGNHEDIQRKAFEEIVTVFGNDTERFVTVQDLSHLKFIECCIKEALRLFPSIPLIARRTTEDIIACGQTIPRDVTVVVVPYCLHKDPQIFSQPNEFIPERFLQNQKMLRNPYAYIPFSAGPRNCIGQRFAMYEMKTIVTHILRNFTVRSLVPTKDVPVSIEVIARSKKPLNVFFRRRL